MTMGNTTALEESNQRLRVAIMYAPLLGILLSPDFSLI